jgi:hypothetical protein
MALSSRSATPSTVERADGQMHTVGTQVFWLLRAGFTLLPILFGLDKFANVLTDWTQYLAPQIDSVVPGTAHQAMLAVGVIEIVAGLVVAVVPRFGGPLVAVWLAGIIVNLLLIGDFYDVALRDLGLLLAAVALSRLAWAAHADTRRSDLPARAV